MTYIAIDGRQCFCSDTDKCVVDNRGIKAPRCCKKEIEDAGHKTIHIGCLNPKVDALYTEVIREKP